MLAGMACVPVSAREAYTIQASRLSEDEFGYEEWSKSIKFYGNFTYRILDDDTIEIAQ